MTNRVLFLVSILAALALPSLLLAQTAADCDFNGSGKVDFLDFLEFATAYSSTSAKHDLNDSGTVDFLDFLVFAKFFGQTVSETHIVQVRLLTTSSWASFSLVSGGTMQGS